MEQKYNPNKHYIISELVTITGLSRHSLNSKKELSSLGLARITATNKPSKIIPLEDFEDYLESHKVKYFETKEFQKYYSKKRPITRQFFNVHEYKDFLELYGIDIHFRTVHYHIKRNKIPAYYTGRYIIPILYVIKTLGIKIDGELNKNIGETIGERNYKFKL